MRVGIIGHGTIGSALAKGLRASPSVTAIDTTTRATSERNLEVAAHSDVMVLCVKPRDAESAFRSIVPALHDKHVVISTAASVGTAELRRWAGEHANVVRAMPNTPARASAAMTVVARDPHASQIAVDTACALFDIVGRTIVMDESLMDAVTAVSGCGPAFAFVAMEAMIDAAIALGIPYGNARELVAQTMLGSAALLLAGDEHPAQLKTAVATPAGRTVRGLLALEEGKVRAGISAAVLAAARDA